MPQVFNETSKYHKGYKTYAAAQARGKEVEEQFKGSCEFRWSVIALPDGRFAPMVLINNSIPGGPGPFLGLRNVFLAN